MSHKIITERGKQFVLVPKKTYDRMIEEIEEIDDIRAYDQAKATPPREYIPLEVVKRMVDGESPVRVWREYRGKTQQQLAEEVKISKPYLSQLEAGLRKASIDVIKRIATALGVDVDDLI